MKINLGKSDMILRLNSAMLLASFFLSDTIPGLAGYIVMALAVYLFTTSFISFCPLYFLFGFSTSGRSLRLRALDLYLRRKFSGR